jgi:hypothetical protein
MKQVHADNAGKFMFVVLVYGMFIPLKKFFLIYGPVFIISMFTRNYNDNDFWTTYMGDQCMMILGGSVISYIVEWIMAISFID